MRDAHKAARQLLNHLDVPRGQVNTAVGEDASGVVIRVLVDPMYWSSVQAPSEFMGFRVQVEKRVQAFGLL